MIKITEPEFPRTQRLFDRLLRWDPRSLLETYGQLGVDALSAATPVDTGETASKWTYKVEGNRERYTITWFNSEMAGTAPLVLLLQHGHATKSGYFLSGRDFINPALYPLYDALSQDLNAEALR